MPLHKLQVVIDSVLRLVGLRRRGQASRVAATGTAGSDSKGSRRVFNS